MTAGWHYGGLIGADPIQTSGDGPLRASVIRTLGGAGRVTGGMAELQLVGTSPETTTRSFDVQWAGAPNGSTLDGSQLLLANGGTLYVAPLSTAFDTSTTGLFTQYSRPSGLPNGGLDCVFVSNDGNWVYYSSDSDLKIYQVALSQPWDFSGLATSATYTAGPYTSGTNWPPNTFGFSDTTFSQDGRMLYVSSAGLNDTYQWQLSTPWLINSMTFVRKYERSPVSASNWFPYSLITNPDFHATPRSADSVGTRWLFIVRDGGVTPNVIYIIEGTAATPYDWSTITWSSATKFDAISSLDRAPRDFDVGPAQQIAAVSDGDPNGSTYKKVSYQIPPFDKPTQRWGRQLGRSPLDGTTLRSTGIISTPEAFQIKL